MASTERILEVLGATWVWFGVMFAMLLLLSWGILRFRKALHSEDDPAAATHEILTHVRELHLRGDLTEVEYRSIKNRAAAHVDLTPRPATTPACTADGTLPAGSFGETVPTVQSEPSASGCAEATGSGPVDDESAAAENSGG